MPTPQSYLMTRLLLLEQQDAYDNAQVKYNELLQKKARGQLTLADRTLLESLPDAIAAAKARYTAMVQQEEQEQAYVSPAEYADALQADLDKRKAVAQKIPLSGAAKQRLINLERLKAQLPTDLEEWGS